MYYYWQRPPQYPPVDPTTFHHSVVTFQQLARNSALILNKLAEPQFAHRLMAAAQAGHQQEVNRLIQSIGAPVPVVTSYTPDGIHLTIRADTQGSPCCTLSMYLRWR